MVLTKGDDDLLLATSGGMAIRFNEQDARLMGRSAAGVKGIELRADDEVIGVVPIRMTTGPDGARSTISPEMYLLTITESGYGKRTPVDEYLVQPEEGHCAAAAVGRIDIGRKTAARRASPGSSPAMMSSSLLEQGILSTSLGDPQTGGTKGARVVRR